VIEIETNGTISPLKALIDRVDQWNVSPKLAHAGDPETRRLRLPALVALRKTERAYLKFVLESPEDVSELEALTAALEWPRERVLLMPQAATRAEHALRAFAIAALSQQRGLGFSPRLHVVSWDGERGR
jgi:organic radical activating enzyme